MLWKSFLAYPNFQLLHLKPTYLSKTAFGIEFLVKQMLSASFLRPPGCHGTKKIAETYKQETRRKKEN